MSFKFEKVFTILDYFDGILSGIANFNGMPHYFERYADAEDDWGDYYLLKPLDDETFELAMEDWAIWKRWYASNPLIKTHPALPEDRQRHTELKILLAQKLTVNPNFDFRAQAKFLADYEGVERQHATNPFAKFQVEWKMVQN